MDLHSDEPALATNALLIPAATNPHLVDWLIKPPQAILEALQSFSLPRSSFFFFTAPLAVQRQWAPSYCRLFLRSYLSVVYN